MRVDYSDYQKLVLGRCERKRQDPACSSLLISATPANLKEECISVYNARAQKVAKGDEKILKDFFGAPSEERDLLSRIRRCPVDRFRPLQSLINGRIKSPDITNIELLAWIIDFPHRPFINEMDVELSEEEGGILTRRQDKLCEKQPAAIGSETSATGDAPETTAAKRERGLGTPVNVSPVESQPKRKRVMLMAVLILGAVLLAGYIFWQEERVRKMAFISGNYGCMYWTGDHYEEARCDEVRKDRFKFPMDFEKMKRFKRITQIDTITEKSIGKIYYIRINGGIEYYTTSGNHPVDITRKLQPLSAYMFGKHLRKKEVADKDQ